MKSHVKYFGMFLLTFGTQLALADVVVIVSAKSPVATLNKDQVSDIFLGRMPNFPDGALATPIEQTDSSTQRQEFHTKVTGKNTTQLKAYWSKQIFTGKGAPPKEVQTAADVVKLIHSNPNMIGYVDKTAIDGSVKTVFTP